MHFTCCNIEVKKKLTSVELQGLSCVHVRMWFNPGTVVFSCMVDVIAEHEVPLINILG
jgi:hypothetical protein